MHPSTPHPSLARLTKYGSFALILVAGATLAWQPLFY